MLLTGTAFDTIAADKAAIVSDWPVLGEVLGEAAICYGSTRDDLTACLERLTSEQLAASSGAMRERRLQTEWRTIAQQTLDLLEEMTAGE